jgi:hypothetical protein
MPIKITGRMWAGIHDKLMRARHKDVEQDERLDSMVKRIVNLERNFVKLFDIVETRAKEDR